MFDLFGTTVRSQTHHGPFKGCLPFKHMTLYHNTLAASIAVFVRIRVTTDDAAHIARKTTTRKDLWQVVNGYITRCRVEETIRYVKQTYNLEDIRQPICETCPG